MHTTETTNGALENVKSLVRGLIQWADADAQHASENDARYTAKDDFQRATILRKVLKLLEQCER